MLLFDLALETRISISCMQRLCRHNQGNIHRTQMSGKILVGIVSAFFVVFFAFETWLMRGLPH